MGLIGNAVKPQKTKKFLYSELIPGTVNSGRFVRTFDVVIVGGGVCGAFLGYCLAKQGLQPVVFDCRNSGNTNCGGIISNLALKKFSLLEGFLSLEHRNDNEYHLISPSGKKVVYRTESNKKLVSFLPDNLNLYLLDSAIRCGSKFIPEKVVDIYSEKGLWKIKTDFRTIRARIIVGADGVRSLVRKTVYGPLNREDLSIGFGYLVKGFPEKRFIKRFLKNRTGYLRINDLGKCSSIGVVDKLCNSGGLKTELDTIIKQELHRLRPFRKWSTLIPSPQSADFFKQSCAGKNWLLAGDAAGHVNFLTGDSLLYALWSAELAAQAIIIGDLRLFDSLWKQEFGNELIKAALNRKLFENRNLLETLIATAQSSNTLSDILFQFFAGDEKIGAVKKRFLVKLPKIFFESAVLSLPGKIKNCF